MPLRLWRKEGWIRICGKLKEPFEEKTNSLFVIHWRALTSTLDTRIEPAAPEGNQVLLLEQGRNVIQTTGVGNQGRVSLQVRITEPGTEIPGMRTMDQARADMGAVQMDPLTRVRLAILTPEPFVSTDEVAIADVVLINPAEQPFDELKFQIRYDPTAVQILDADADNYITTGLNIFDGDFHSVYPFDYHSRNEVDPRRGVITYHMGSTVGASTYPSGTLARIVYRMRRQAGMTSLWFERVDPMTGEIVTDISDRGRSLMGRTEDQAGRVLHGVEVAVRPLDLREKIGAAAE